MKFKIRKTDDTEKLEKLFIDNGLDLDEDDDVQVELIKQYEAIDEDTGKLAGGVTLEIRDGTYVVGCLAVNVEYRKHDLGETLLKQVVDDANDLDVDKLMLVAKVPEFFKKYGFIVRDFENSPNISHCEGCEQRDKTCFPVVMERDL